MARPAGFEPTTPWFVARYSIQLSYGRELSIISASPFLAAGGASPHLPRRRCVGVRRRRHSVHAFQPHATPSQPASTATGHARTRGNHAATIAMPIVIIATIVEQSRLGRAERAAIGQRRAQRAADAHRARGGAPRAARHRAPRGRAACVSAARARLAASHAVAAREHDLGRRARGRARTAPPSPARTPRPRSRRRARSSRSSSRD